MVHAEGFEGRCQKVLQVANGLYQSKPDWVTFFRETLGVNGAARNVFSTQDEYISFEQRPEFNDIQQMVANLRNRKIPGNGSNEPTRVITVRLPESLHEALKAEASDHNTSMNKLCISKLLQVLIENEKGAAAAAAAKNQASQGRTAPVPAPTRSNVPPVPKPSVPVGSNRMASPATASPSAGPSMMPSTTTPSVGPVSRMNGSVPPTHSQDNSPSQVPTSETGTFNPNGGV